MDEYIKAIKLQKEIDELKKHNILIGVEEKIKELDKLGFEYMEYNMSSSIRRKRK